VPEIYDDITLPTFAAGELFANVGDDDHDHAGHEESLHKAPEDELPQVL
jgi:hypothetical protein